MINNYPIVNVYEKNSFKSKLSSQLIYGEKFKILKKKKDWLKIRTSYDKYTGFIKKKNFLKSIKITHKVSSLSAKLYSKPKEKFLIRTKLPFCSRISVKEIKNNSNVFKEITKNKKINNITNHLFLIDSIIQSENRFSISLYNNAKKANIFMVFNIEETHKIKNSIKNKYKNIEFENFEDYYINNLNNEIFFTIINKNLVISSSKILF